MLIATSRADIERGGRDVDVLLLAIIIDLYLYHRRLTATYYYISRRDARVVKLHCVPDSALIPACESCAFCSINADPGSCNVSTRTTRQSWPAGPRVVAAAFVLQGTHAGRRLPLRFLVQFISVTSVDAPSGCPRRRLANPAVSFSCDARHGVHASATVHIAILISHTPCQSRVNAPSTRKQSFRAHAPI
eukprot:IDg17307t1